MQLHCDFCTLTMDGIDQITERTDEPIVIDTDRMPGGATDFPIDGCVFGDDQAYATSRSGTMVLNELVVDLSKGARELSKNGRLHESVAQVQVADTTGLE
jgi:hypothetical protein